VVTRTDAEQWVAGYVAAWRAPGTDGLGALFAEGAQYLHSPYAEPIVGLVAIGQMWEEEREGPDEVFTFESRVLVMEGDTAVVRALVRYGSPVRQEYTDLWVVQFEQDGRCIFFEEWPFWPDKPWSGEREPTARVREYAPDRPVP
jgi:ketosteroid isomerase-like protein